MKIKDLISVVSSKRTDYNTKITETEEKLTDYNHDKNVKTPAINTIPAGVFDARLT